MRAAYADHCRERLLVEMIDAGGQRQEQREDDEAGQPNGTPSTSLPTT